MTKHTKARSRRRPVMLLTLLVMLSALVCGAIAGGGAASLYAAPGPGTAAGATPPTLRLSFVGDILLDKTVGELIKAQGPLAPWEGVKDILSAADLTCGNLETAVGTTGSPTPGKTWTFRSDPAALQGLVDSGFDVVSIANNHTLDYGVECLLETVQSVNATGTITPIGAGANRTEARKPYIFEKNGIKVGILATTAVYAEPSWGATDSRPGMAIDGQGNLNPEIKADIQQLRESVDIVVVVVHWGYERETVPSPKIAPIQKAMKDAGADAIIGSHPHVLQGVYYDGSALTAYSLGNFVFTTRPDTPACQLGSILTLTVSKDKVEAVEAIPTKIVWGKTVVLEGAEKATALSTLSSLSRPLGTDLDPEGNVVPLLYTDMNNHWARFTVGRLAARGSVEGYPDLTFRPGVEITKDEFAAMFTRAVVTAPDIDAAPEPAGFTLCAKDAWSYRYMKYLASAGVVSPADPNWVSGKPCTRLDACIAMWKRNGSPTSTGPAPAPAAAAEISGLNATDAAAVSWAMEKGILRGYPDGSLGLAGTITRAEMAEVLWRYLVMSTTPSA